MTEENDGGLPPKNEGGSQMEAKVSKFFSEVHSFAKKGTWQATTVGFLGLVLIIAIIIWPGAFLTIVIIAASVTISFHFWPKGRIWTRTTLALVIAPLVIPPLVIYYLMLIYTPWERKIDPPVIQVVWNCEVESFQKAQQPKLQRWNPLQKKGEDTIASYPAYSLLVTAAQRNGLDFDKVILLQEGELSRKAQATVTFQCTSAGDTSGNSAKKPKAKLKIIFETHKSVSGGKSNHRKMSLTVAENLELQEAYFTAGFAGVTDNKFVSKDWKLTPVEPPKDYPREERRVKN